MSTRPNLLLIWTDQQRADTMACYGNDQIQVPNLNRLASQSHIFENAYCVQPICTPSRASILTGLWPHTHGCIRNNVPLPTELPTIAEMLGDDYRCAYYGKWHLGDEIIAQRGFDQWRSIEDGWYRSYYSDARYLEKRSDYHRFLKQYGFVPNHRAKDGAWVFSRVYAAAMAETFTKATFLGHEAARYINEQSNAPKPWFLSVNFLEPHDPYFGPLNHLYDPDELNTGPAFNTAPPENAAYRNRALSAFCRSQGYLADNDGITLKDEAGWRRLRANYMGLVTLVDSAVGSILAALDQSGQADDTIVVFTSDHGEMMGDHAIWGKCVMYEESIRIPLLMRIPQLQVEQEMIPGRFSQIDLAPTLMELLGQPISGHLQGKSRAGVLSGHETLNDNNVIVCWNGGAEGGPSEQTPGFAKGHIAQINQQQWRTIITTDGWKLNLCTSEQDEFYEHCELYDLNNDPYEQSNLFNEPDHKNRICDLASLIRDWQQQTGDTAQLQHV